MSVSGIKDVGNMKLASVSVDLWCSVSHTLDRMNAFTISSILLLASSAFGSFHGSYDLSGGHGLSIGHDYGGHGQDFSPQVEHHHVGTKTIEHTKPVHVNVVKKIGVPVPHAVGVPVPHVIKVPVPQPYPVHIPVPQPVPVPIYKLVPQEVEKKVPYTVEKIVPYAVEKPFKIEVPKPIPVPVPVYKTIYHHSPKSSKW